MELFINYSILTTALWLIVMAQVTKATGFYAAIIFKAIPMVLGLACLYSAGKLFGWL